MKANWKDVAVELPTPEKWYLVTFDGELLMEPNFVSTDIFEENRTGVCGWKTASEEENYRVIAWTDLPEMYDETKEDNGDWIKFDPDATNPFETGKSYILTIEFVEETESGEIADSYKTIEVLEYHGDSEVLEHGFCIEETLADNESYVVLAYQEAPEAFVKEN